MEELSGRIIRDKFLEGEFSAVEITNHFLNRIDRYDGKVGAFLSIFRERSLKKAKELDNKKAAGKPLGKLAGIPIALKDNLLVKDEITTCASKFLTNYRSIYNASVVDYLEEEDAIIIGKTNLDEFAMGASCEFSALQQTYNPWHLDCVTGGSSGGSAAAVAARMCPISLGSDTGGSIRQPASFCGIIGMKPTYGRVSRYGLVAFGSSLDQIGPFANCMGDVALVMEVLSRKCPMDSTSVAAENNGFMRNLRDDLQGVKVGVPWKFLEKLSGEVRANFEDSLQVLKELGAECVDVSLEMLKYSIAIYYIIATAEASTNLARFDGIRYGKRSKHAENLDQVYDFSKEEGFGPEVKRRIMLGTYVLTAGFQDAYYKKAQKVRALMIEEYARAFEQCNVVALPTSPFPAFKIGAIHDPLEMYLADIFTASANLAGLPGISVPSGFSTDGKPLGLQLIGPQMRDVSVCGIAHAFEKAVPYSQAIPPLLKEEK